MKKEDYIKKKIASIEKRRSKVINEYNKKMAKFDILIKHYQNLSDEHFEVINYLKTLKEPTEQEIIDDLSKIGLTLEDFDNMSMEDVKKMDKKIKNQLNRKNKLNRIENSKE
jgi:hypothetical protein